MSSRTKGLRTEGLKSPRVEGLKGEAAEEEVQSSGAGTLTPNPIHLTPALLLVQATGEVDGAEGLRAVGMRRGRGACEVFCNPGPQPKHYTPDRQFQEREG
mmetsp:Transcript_41405/g.64657  ORF Transcript_41405/g.64657 Transcript_41405/m.64657 type:complete len:101 (-) Transcript_41405:173-475(-)